MVYPCRAERGAVGTAVQRHSARSARARWPGLQRTWAAGRRCNSPAGQHRQLTRSTGGLVDQNTGGRAVAPQPRPTRSAVPARGGPAGRCAGGRCHGRRSARLGFGVISVSARRGQFDHQVVDRIAIAALDHVEREMSAPHRAERSRRAQGCPAGRPASIRNRCERTANTVAGGVATGSDVAVRRDVWINAGLATRLPYSPGCIDRNRGWTLPANSTPS